MWHKLPVRHCWPCVAEHTFVQSRYVSLGGSSHRNNGKCIVSSSVAVDHGIHLAYSNGVCLPVSRKSFKGSKESSAFSMSGCLSTWDPGTFMATVAEAMDSCTPQATADPLIWKIV